MLRIETAGRAAMESPDRGHRNRMVGNGTWGVRKGGDVPTHLPDCATEAFLRISKDNGAMPIQLPDRATGTFLRDTKDNENVPTCLPDRATMTQRTKKA